MKPMGNKACHRCGNEVTSDVMALNRKLVGRQTKRFLCLRCLSEHLETSENELLRLIKELRESGCALFM